MKKKAKSPNYENWPRKKINIADLFLDAENIRLQVEGNPSQAALISDLFLNENAMQVLESIARNTFFPDELPVVIKEKNRFVVMDGNRRVAALKALKRPSLVPLKESAIKELLKSVPRVTKDINVVVAPNRNSVKQLLASKHTLETRRRWRPLRQAYFYKAELDRGRTVSQLRNDYPNVDIDRFLRLINFHRIAKSLRFEYPKIERKIHNERTFQATTLARLYEDKNVRQFLGFEFDKNGEVKINIAKKEFEKGLKQILSDITDKKIDSRTLNKERNRLDYLRNFPRSSIPIRKKGSKAFTSKDFSEIVPSNIRQKRSLAPKDISSTLKVPGISRMLEELQSIDYHKFPNAAHDLLRSFLECSLKVYLKEKKINVKLPRNQKYVFLSTVLQEFIRHLDDKKERGLSQVTRRILSNATMTSYSAQFLNATNHNPDVFAIDKEVKEAWDTMESIFRYILDPA